jgi:alpha-glucosidase (family GH31 glycosyl hydrolase)
LVAPVLQPNQTSRMVYLPEGAWYDYWTGKKYAGGTMIRVDAPLETVPLFVRAGAVIPLGPEMNYIGEKPGDPINFMIYTDEKGQAATTLYEDDGTSPAYRQGVFRRTSLSVTPSGKGYQINLSAPQGSYTPAPRKFVFNLKSISSARVVSVDGKTLGASRAGDGRDGWYTNVDGLAVRLTDDGKAHQISIR